jgi:threonyl-tRNA synthetase
MADSEVILIDGRRVRVPADRPLLDSLAAAGSDRIAGAVAASYDGQVVDFVTPVPAGAVLTLVPADSPDGLRIVRHSTAHLMAAAVQALFPGAKFAIGPAIDDGFYYDMELPRALAPEDLPVIEAKMRELAAKRLPFDRREMDMQAALAWARDTQQAYKVEILEALRDFGTPSAKRQAPSADVEELAGEAAAGAGSASFYRTGEFIDLCRGPHVPDTSWLTAFRLTHLAGAYWRGDERRPMLQRI